MEDFWKLFFSGAVASLPSIIAAIGIIVNNWRASSRQKKDRSIKLKTDLIEKVYEEYNSLANNYLEIVEGFRRRLLSIHREVLFVGTEDELKNYLLELKELQKKAIFFAAYRYTMIDAYNLDISADEMVKSIIESANKTILSASLVAYITKLFVTDYRRTKDFEITRENVVSDIRDKNGFTDYYKSNIDSWGIPILLQEEINKNDLIKNYREQRECLDNHILGLLNESIMKVIEKYVDSLECSCSEALDLYEEKLAASMKQLIR